MNEKSKPESAIQSSKDASKVIIEINGMHKWFGTFHVLKNINLTVNTGERIVICGPSGSGKSTLIRCINRLEEHQEGTIVVDDVELTGDLKNIEIIRSDVGIVFQQFNLFPHLTVLENCSLAPIWVRNGHRNPWQNRVEIRTQCGSKFVPKPDENSRRNRSENCTKTGPKILSGCLLVRFHRLHAEHTSVLRNRPAAHRAGGPDSVTTPVNLVLGGRAEPGIL